MAGYTSAGAGACGVPVRFNVYPLGTRAMQLPGVRLASELGQRPTAGEEFLQRFGKPERLLGCECERSEGITLSQAFQLLTGSLVNDMLTAPANRIGRLLALGRKDEEIVEELYVATLGRYPTPQEMQGTLRIVEHGPQRRAAASCSCWCR